jgi:hypothetical protein
METKIVKGSILQYAEDGIVEEMSNIITSMNSNGHTSLETRKARAYKLIKQNKLLPYTYPGEARIRVIKVGDNFGQYDS